jgi:phytoene dehydrogenase-like protein
VPDLTKDVVVIGAGLAGLRCAALLRQAGLDVALLEAVDAPGGRVRTDAVDGFLLDRGFQVLLTAYPEAQAALDYAALDLRPLKPGALVWKDGRFHRFSDPFREPLAAISLAFDSIVTLGDKLRVAGLRGGVMRGGVAEIFLRPETTTRAFLDGFGFSPKIVESFFEPFFGGVFLECDLATSSRYFEFLFRMFSAGPVAVPAAGMEAIPRQLAALLAPGTLLTRCRVSEVAANGAGFTTVCGAELAVASRAVVLAVDEPEARRLERTLNPAANAAPPRAWNSTTAFYFAADQPPVEGPLLLLNGEGKAAGPVNNAAVMSEVAASYAPAGASLVSASVVGSAPTGRDELAALERQVRRHLSHWFGPQVEAWRGLGARPVPRALPLQTTARWESTEPASPIPGVFVCGDFLETASIQGSLASGRRAAQSLLAFARR